MVLLCCGLLIVGCSDDDDSASNDDDDTEEVVDGGEETPGNEDSTFDDFQGIVTAGGRVAFIAESNDGNLEEFEGIYTDIEADSLVAAAGTRASLRQVASTRDDDDASNFNSPTNVGGNVGEIDVFTGLALEGDNIYFGAANNDDDDGSSSDDDDAGIYVDNEGSLTTLVESGDSAPDGGNEFFTNFTGMDVQRDSGNDNDLFAFVADVEDTTPSSRTSGEGIYFTSDGGVNITTVADEATSAPSNGGNGNEVFTGFGNNISINEDGTVAFEANFSDEEEKTSGFGVFTGQSGEANITLIADDDTTMPGTTDNEFELFRAVSINDEGSVAFIGTDFGNSRRNSSDRVSGVYSNLSGSLAAIADTNTIVPDGSGNEFCVFLNAVIDGDRIVFSAIDEEFASNTEFTKVNGKRELSLKNNSRDLDGSSGIYVFHSGDTLEKIIDNTDLISGSSDQTFRIAIGLDFQDDEINASIATSGSDDFDTDTILTIEDTPSIVSFRTQKKQASTNLNWQTVCGEVLGFHVWRSSGEEYERITSSAIAPDRSESRKAVKFSYTDNNAEEGQSFYKLEVMKLDGTSEMIRPAYNN